VSDRLPWEDSENEDAHEDLPLQPLQTAQTPKRGSTLEGRVRALFQAKGYRAVTNKIVFDHEIDVWGEDENQRVAVAECKEYYATGPVTCGHVRNFFGKVFDIEHNYGENVYLAMFVSISGFTDTARALCDRLGILAVDAATLEVLEMSSEELTPRRSTLEDQAVLELRKQRDRLHEEITRRNLVRKLSQQIDDFNRILETKTLPGFLIPTTVSNSFWYSMVDELPFVGLNGTFKDFAAPMFPRLTLVLYEQRRLLGRKAMAISTDHLAMSNGVVHVREEALKDAAIASQTEVQPLVSHLLSRLVITADQLELGTVTDLLISYRNTQWVIESLKVASSGRLRARLAQPDFSIPSERVSLREDETIGWQILAHVKVAL